MKIIQTKPYGGKTTQIIKNASNFNGYIVCKDVKECGRIFEEAKKLNIKINFPITFSEFENKQYHSKGIKCFHIDNAEYLLQYLCTVKIESISINEDE